MIESTGPISCHTECVCRRCEAMQTGAFAYAEIAASLGSDDDARIYPVWLATCLQRVWLHAHGQAGKVAA